jgi:DNA-binding beta-propeller fold protein YncE
MRILPNQAFFTTAALLLAATACGDNGETANKPDAKPAFDGNPGDAPAARTTALIVAGEFGGTGSIARIDVAAKTAEKNAVPGAADADVVSRLIGNELFILNRVRNNLTVLDRGTLAPKLQIALGDGSNPQDAAVSGNKIYVPLLGGKGVAVVTRGSQTVTEIDLSNLDAVDQQPDCNGALVVGNQLFVQCGMLKNFVPTQNGKIVVINTVNDQVTTTLTLPERNPFGLMIQSPAASKFAGDILVSTVPSFTTVTQGCVVRIKPGATPTVGECAIQNAALTAFPSRLAISADGKDLWVAVKGFGAGAQLRRVDLTTGTVDPQPLSPAAQEIADVATCPDGSIVVSDATAASFGVRVYSKTAEVTTTPIDIGIKPGAGAGINCF